MSLISEQVQELRNLAEDIKCKNKEDNIVKTLQIAADTIEALSVKLASENMKRSKIYYDNEGITDEIMIRASIHSKLTTNDLLNIYNKNGLIGVYNLGLKNMYIFMINKNLKK